MYRKVFRPVTVSELTLTLPAEFIDKEIEVIAFDIVRNDSENIPAENNAERREQIRKMLDSFPKVKMSGFKFSRDEANDYE